MKILVLSCSTGEGHNSAARALCAQAAEMGIDADLADPVSFAGPRAARAVAGLYNRMIRHVPPLFGAVYALGGAYAAKALVCCRLSGSPSARQALRQRARDMNILLIEDVDKLQRSQLAALLRREASEGPSVSLRSI